MGVYYYRCRYTDRKIMRPGLKLIGAKTRIRDFLYSFFPEHQVYVEPFMGTGGVLIGKPQCEFEYTGDLNSYAINYYHRMQQNPEELWWYIQHYLRELRGESVSPEGKEAFENFKYRITRTSHPDVLASYFYLITKHCFNGIWRLNAEGECNSSYGQTLKGRGIFTKEWYDAVRERIGNVTYLNLPYEKTLEVTRKHEGRDCFVFLDPPYHSCLTTYNGESWHEEEYQKLYVELMDADYKWMLTINDHPYIVDLFKDFEMVNHEVFYNCSQTVAGRGKLPELIIGNYDLRETHDKFVRIAIDGKEEAKAHRTETRHRRIKVD